LHGENNSLGFVEAVHKWCNSFHVLPIQTYELICVYLYFSERLCSVDDLDGDCGVADVITGGARDVHLHINEEVGCATGEERCG